MIVLVDTTIWSLALRRRPQNLRPDEEQIVDEWCFLVTSGQATLMAPIRQEVLSGIRQESVFLAIQEQLSHFRYLEILPKDYDVAAHFFNSCRSHGVTGGPIDMLICAVACRFEVPIFTTDTDFFRYGKHLEIQLHKKTA